MGQLRNLLKDQTGVDVAAMQVGDNFTLDVPNKRLMLSFSGRAATQRDLSFDQIHKLTPTIGKSIAALEIVSIIVTLLSIATTIIATWTSEKQKCTTSRCKSTYSKKTTYKDGTTEEETYTEETETTDCVDQPNQTPPEGNPPIGDPPTYKYCPLCGGEIMPGETHLCQ